MAELITLDEYKEFKDIKSATRDGKIEALILQVSNLIENYCNRKFTAYSESPNFKREWFDSKTHEVFLSEFPVLDIISVSTSTDGGLTQVPVIIADTTGVGYFIDIVEGRVFTQSPHTQFLSNRELAYRSLEIDYHAGYTMADIPEDLKLAVIDLITYYLNNEKHPTQTLAGATIENPFPSTGQGFPSNIRRILDLYRFSP